MRVCPRHPRTSWQGSPRQRRTLRRRGLQKLALNSGITRRSAKKGVNTAENPVPRPSKHRRHNPKSRDLSLLRAGMSTTSAMHDHRDVHNFVEASWALVVVHTGMSTTLSKNCVGARLSSPRLHSETATAQQGPRSPCQCTATGEFVWFPEQDHGNLSLHHDRDVDDLVQICDELQLQNLHSFLHCHNPSTCCCTTTGVSTVSKNCKTRRCMITGTSATLMNCTKKSSTTLSRYCTAELPKFSARRTRHAQKRACHHLIQELQLRNPRAALSGPKPLSCTTTGKTTLSKSWTPTSTICTTGTSTTTSKKAHAARNAASPAPPHHNRRDPATAPPTCPFLTEPQPALAWPPRSPAPRPRPSKKAVGLHDAAIVV